MGEIRDQNEPTGRGPEDFDPLLLRAMRRVMACRSGEFRCRHLSPEERRTLDSWYRWWGLLPNFWKGT